MSELNQEYGEAVDRLDSWVKSYIEEVCISFDPSRIKLYWEKPKGNASKVKWGFSVEGPMKKEGPHYNNRDLFRTSAGKNFIICGIG